MLIRKSSESQLATLILGSHQTSVLCHMGDFGCGDGGWTPVMKMNGNEQTFHFNSDLWSNKKNFNLDGGKTGFDSQETKLPSYWNTSFSKICLGMKIGQHIKFIVINQQANSLHSLIADGVYHATSLGRDTWKSLIGGFNVEGNIDYSKARIGIIGNEQGNCDSADSRIGFGTGGYPETRNTCGNEAKHEGDNDNKQIRAMGYILVQ
ncbi:unnamed protein product [Porites lobata]|uniref:Lectin n=1 Tax=Porites lobata TaxID=104759 RepID=A0ABN8NNW6_9CNID|nr:unnamed protein product [Porites lobata]